MGRENEFVRLLRCINLAVARYADCSHNGNPATSQSWVNPARNSQSFIRMKMSCDHDIKICKHHDI